MKPRLLLSACLGLAVSACSWITDIAVVNRTKDPIKVTYWLRRLDATEPYCRCPDGYHFLAPAVVDLKDLKKSGTEWIQLDSSAYAWQGDSLRVEVELPPETALRIEELGTYTGPNPWEAAEFNITAVEIAHQSAVTRQVGDSVLFAFRKRSKFLYVLELPSEPERERPSPLLGRAT